LKTPTWQGLRPTSDKLRETLFNVLTPQLEGARVLDGFAGTGALGIEAVSRGASHVTFIEQELRAQELLVENLQACGVENGCAIIRSSFARAVTTLRADPAFVPFTIVLLDPPYDQQPDEILADAAKLVAPNGLVVLERARKQQTPERVAGLVRIRDVVSGDSALSIYGVSSLPTYVNRRLPGFV
jgi:16S rRNA (guanine966-N2)-methyltransferase